MSNYLRLSVLRIINVQFQQYCNRHKYIEELCTVDFVLYNNVQKYNMSIQADNQKVAYVEQFENNYSNVLKYMQTCRGI